MNEVTAARKHDAITIVSQHLFTRIHFLVSAHFTYMSDCSPQRLFEIMNLSLSL